VCSSDLCTSYEAPHYAVFYLWAFFIIFGEMREEQPPSV
jgi:hypothetical protein